MNECLIQMIFVNSINFKIKNRNNDYFEMLFDLEVKSSNHVDEIINALKVKQVVQYIDRDKSDS